MHGLTTRKEMPASEGNFMPDPGNNCLMGRRAFYKHISPVVVMDALHAQLSRLI
jgi:hypothetical protein